MKATILFSESEVVNGVEVDFYTATIDYPNLPQDAKVAQVLLDVFNATTQQVASADHPAAKPDEALFTQRLRVLLTDAPAGIAEPPIAQWASKPAHSREIVKKAVLQGLAKLAAHGFIPAPRK